MHNILYIATSFEQKNSSSAIRNNSLVKGLIENGCNVTVLTPKWPDYFISDYFRSKQNFKIIRTDIPLLKTLEKVHFLKSNKRNRFFLMIKKFILEFFIFPDICKDWPSFVSIDVNNNYDIIISSSDLKSSHYVANLYKKKFPELQWIQVWGDPWFLDFGLGKLTRIRAKSIEKKLLEKADKIVYVSSLTSDKMKNNYKNIKNKIFHIPRGYYMEICKNLTDRNYYRIVYTGALSNERKFECFLQEIDYYNKTAAKQITVEFYGDFIDEVASSISSFKCTKIIPGVDFDEIQIIYANSDGLLFISNRVESTQIPGKLFDYMATELPIISLVYDTSDKLSEILKSFNKCLLIENTNKSIKDNIDNVIEKLSHRSMINTDFAPINIAKKLLNII